MANEIAIQLSVRVQNGSFLDQFTPGQVLVDQASIGRGGYTQSIGTSEGVVNFGDITTAGWLALRNLDDTFSIQYGPTLDGAMVVFGRLRAGEVALLRLEPGIVMRAKAVAEDTATPDASLLDVRLYED